MANYFLIARNIDNNDFHIIELKSKWYQKNGTDIKKRSNSLEAIDLVTTRFNSKEQMTKRLYTNGYLDFGEYDYFIVSKYRKNKEEKLKYQEVIFNKRDERTAYFKDIAVNSLNKNINCEANIRLLDRFINKMYYVEDYRKIVRDNLTALNYKFINVFNNIEKNDSIPYKLKYQNNWCLQNYQISRSIVDSFNRYDELYNQDVYKNHVEYFNKLAKERFKIHKSLLKVCDKDYIEGQISLFDKKEQIEKNLSIEEKKKYVINKLTHLGVQAFTYEDNKYQIILDDYLEFIDKDQMKILTNINPKLIKLSYLYNLHIAKMNNPYTSYANYFTLQTDANEDLKDLKNYLNSDKIIEKAYTFCKTFEQVKQCLNKSEDVKKYKKN